MATNVGDQIENVVLDGVKVAMKPVKKVSTAVQNLVSTLKEKYPNGFEFDNVLEVNIAAMRHLAIFNKEMNGRQKKKMVVDALILLLDETDSGEYEKYEHILKYMLPTLIDGLIDVEKGKISINKRLKKVV